MKRIIAPLAALLALLPAACGSATRAASTPTVTVTTTETVTAEPAASDGSYSGPVEGEPGETLAANPNKLTLGEPFPMTAGVVVTIGAPEAHKIENRLAIGAEEGDMVTRFAVRLENGSDKPVGTTPLTLQVASGDKGAEEVFDGDACEGPGVEAIPGRAIEWARCFKTEPGQKIALLWSWRDPESWESMDGFLELDPVF